MIQAQIDEITTAIAEEKAEQGGRYTIKQMERTRKGLEARLKKLNDQSPHQLFSFLYGADVLESLKSRLIAPSEITLKPELLK